MEPARDLLMEPPRDAVREPERDVDPRGVLPFMAQESEARREAGPELVSEDPLLLRRRLPKPALLNRPIWLLQKCSRIIAAAKPVRGSKSSKATVA